MTTDPARGRRRRIDGDGCEEPEDDSMSSSNRWVLRSKENEGEDEDEDKSAPVAAGYGGVSQTLRRELVAVPLSCVFVG